MKASNNKYLVCLNAYLVFAHQFVEQNPNLLGSHFPEFSSGFLYSENYLPRTFLTVHSHSTFLCLRFPVLSPDPQTSSVNISWNN